MRSDSEKKIILVWYVMWCTTYEMKYDGPVETEEKCTSYSEVKYAGCTVQWLVEAQVEGGSECLYCSVVMFCQL